MTDDAPSTPPSPPPSRGPLGAPQKKASWMQRRNARAHARKLYAKNDLPGFLAHGQAHPEVYAQNYGFTPSGKDSIERSLPLFEACAMAQRDEWVLGLLQAGATPLDKDKPNLICAAAAHSGEATIKALIAMDPTIVFLRKEMISGDSDALDHAVRYANKQTLAPLLEETLRVGLLSQENPNLADIRRADIAQRSWRGAQAEAYLRLDQRSGSEEKDAAAKDIYHLFATHPSLDIKDCMEREKERMRSDATATAAFAEGAVAVAPPNPNQHEEMPAFAKILLAKIDELQSQVKLLDARVSSLVEANAPPREERRPVPAPPLSRLGLIGQRFRKSAPEADSKPSSSPKPPG